MFVGVPVSVKARGGQEVDAGWLPPPLSTSCFEDLSLNLDLIVSAQL